MNKKFSTLMALALVAGSVSAQNWQDPTNATVQGAYRTFETKSASGRPAENPAVAPSGNSLATGGIWSKDVQLVNSGLWYQLEVKNEDTDYADVLIQERDYETGKVYLRTVSKKNAPLNASLWQLRYGKEDEATGGHWTLVNKETNLELTFDQATVANDSVSEMRNGVDVWAWYDFNRTDKKDYKKIYASLHNQVSEEVMYLAYEETTDASEYGTVQDLRNKLKTDGFGFWNSAYTTSGDDGDQMRGRMVKAVVKRMSSNDIDGEVDALEIKPVVANPFFMTAEQFNTRMDADNKMNKDTFSFKMNKELEGSDVFLAQYFTAETNKLRLNDNALNGSNNVNTLNADGTAFAQSTENSLSPIKNKFDLNFKTSAGTYLLADTARYQEDDHKPSVSPAVKFALKTPNNKDGVFMKARYYFRATYFPTNDSIVIEPLNAAVQADFEWDADKYWSESAATTSFARTADYSKANTLVNDYTSYTSKTVSLIAATIPGVEKKVITVAKDGKGEFKVKTFIDRPFEYLTRTTVPSGLYYINLANGDERQRAAGMSIVHNMDSKLMYDTQAKNQDYSLMPSTMWVIKQLGCPLNEDAAKYVEIRNREYGKKDVVFVGQLYKVRGIDAAGDSIDCYRFIDRSADYVKGYTSTGWLKGQHFRVADLMDIQEVKEDIAYTSTHGYKWFNDDFLNDGVENNFQINWNNAYNDNLVLKHVNGQNIQVTDGDATIYEIAEATLPTDQGVIRNEFGAVLDPVINLEGEKDTVLPQLDRKAYLIKVKDANLIDNDQLYLASVRDNDGRYYYKAMKLSEMDNYQKKLAVVYLKADQIHFDAEGNPADTAYVFVDINEPRPLNATQLKSWNNYKLKTDNGWMKAAVEAGSGMSMIRDNNLQDQPNDVSDAFYFNGNPVNQYIDIAADYSVDLNSNIKIYSKLAQNNYLFEDCKDANNVQAIQKINPDFHYLGVESKGLDVEKNAALYVDEVVKDNANMQRYLFGVRVDSIADGYICKTQTHGYWQTAEAAETADETHYDVYNGYTAGWFLVNLEDSIGTSTNMMHNADLYKFNSYTRLGFVEGIHMVEGDAEYLYVVNAGYTLDDLMTIKDNSTTAQAKYTKAGYVLDPEKLAVDETSNVGKYVKRHDIAGNINTNHTFSLRKTQDEVGTTTESEPFLLESFVADENGKPISAIGSFVGAWVKSENGVPVLAKFATAAGDHEWDGSSVAERIGQSGVFYFGTTKDEATANDEVSVSSVTVIAGNGNLQIAGASGKKVVITNILGQTVANTVVTSDNATIAAPAGVVVVAVEGEDAVKAIVK